jgi:hypothetical protein
MQLFPTLPSLPPVICWLVPVPAPTPRFPLVLQITFWLRMVWEV